MTAGARVAAPPAAPSACAWCDAPLGPAALQAPGGSRCAACGAITTAPRPDDATLARAYGDWYRPAAGPRFAGGLGDALLRRTRGALAWRLDAVAPPGPVLDVGAGEGWLLDALRRRGRVAAGLERDARRPDIRAGTLEDVEGAWAAVVFWHALEHLPEPGAAIAHAARLLVPGGVVVVAAPNAGSLQARVFGERWLHLDLPRHLVHLPARTLEAGLERHGLRVERRSGVRGGQVVIGWLHGLVGSLPGRPDLYAALRRPGARERPLPPARRAAALAAGGALLPAAIALAAAEVALGRAGTAYVEARRG